MEITTTSGGASARMPELVAEAWTTPARRRPTLLVVGLLALLAFFVLGRESASAVWDIANAKLVAINNGGGTYLRSAFVSVSSPSVHVLYAYTQTNLHFKFLTN